jgi:arylsulfatase A-like enzyme/O-glycosyl hydrolase
MAEVNFVNYSSFGSSVEYTSNGLLLDYGTPLWQSSSSVIYGGMYVNSTLTDHAGSLFFGGGFADGTQVRLNPANGSYQLGDQVTTLCLFKEDDFIDPVSTGFVYAFEAGSNSFSGSITYDPRGAAQGELNEDVFDRGEIRWVIQNDNQYFISEVVSSFTNSITFFNVNSDVFTLDWFNYDPYGLGTIESANYISIVGNSVTPSFDDIKAVGFRFQVDIGSGSSSTAQPKLGINFFQVNGTTQEPQTDEGKCIIDRDRTYQKMEGFGASVAFYERLMVDHNQTSELADLLFRDLKLDILRVQNVYQHTGSNWTSSFSDFQNTYAAGTNALGRDVKVLLSSWTPPASLKSHNNLWGTYNDVIGTLAKDGSGNYRYADFATWWKDSVDYYRNNGIRVDYVSIQNEPNWHPEYNGCAFEPSETTSRAGYNKALDAVWREFADSYGVLGVPKMIGPETIGINKADEYIDALIHRERMYGYAHHLYQQSPATNPDVLNAQMRQTKDKYDYRPLMQTEYAYLDPHTISDEQRKLNQAKLMHNALTEEGVSVYLYWALFWQMQDQEGLINIPNTPSAAYQINPEYYAFKHFSAFIHEDWRRVYADPGVHGVSVSAFTSPERDRMSVVLINENNTYEYVDMVFSNMNISIGSIYRTDASQDCAVVGFYSPSQSQIEIPPNSITTLDLQTDLLAAPSVTNVLMIAIDDLRPQLRTYGHGQMHTPNLDQLARDGYQFNRAYSQYAVCAPSRASIMTGFRPNMTQTFNYDGNFRDQLPWAQTLPMKLRNNGYTTLGIGKIYHVISGQNDPLTWSNEGSGGWSSGGGISGTTPAQQDGWTYSAYQRHAGTDDSLRDGSVANIASLTLGLLKNQQPFFYGVGFIRPHLPFVAPDAYWDLYSVNDLDIPEITSEPLNGLSYSYDNWTELRPSGGGGYYGIPTSGPVSSDQRRDLIHGYYACVSYVDAQVGRLMGALKEQGLDKNTIVIVWGDHGYHLGENGQWCKHSNFELDTRIPLLIHVPWMPGATQVDALTESLDIYPTILELCGIDRPSFLEGESLVPVMNNPVQTSSTEAVSQYERSNGPTMGYSLRTDRYRYTEWRRAGQTAPVSNGYELYDHFTDPHEDTNIYSSASTTLRNTLASQLATYVPENYGGSDPVYENAFSDLLTGAGLSGVNALVNADPDSDGMSNIEEYAFNLDPTVSDRVMVTVGSGISGMPAPYTYAETNQTQGVNLISNGDFNNGVADGWTYRQGGGAVTSSSVWDGTWVAMQMGTEPVLKLGPNSNAGTELWQLSVNQVVACNPASSYVIKLSAIAQEARDIKIIWRNVADNDSGVYFDSGIISLQNKVVTNLVYNVLPTNLSEVDLNGELRIQVGGDGTRVHIDEVEVIEQASSGSDASSRLAIEYIRRKNASDLTYQPSFESNLSSSNWVDASNHQTATSIDSLWERVRVEDPDASATNSTRFGRLEVLFEYSE